MSKNLLLLSNSTNYGESYLQYPEIYIKNFLSAPKQLLFIPYAAVSFSWSEYEQKVSHRFAQWGYRVTSIHHYSDVKQAIREAQAIVVGGGNTWQLVRILFQQDLLEVIRKRVEDGVPYVGWSAGANIACPTLQTTNDMPIVNPLTFETLNLVPFQINPHYTDASLENHGGETRDMRIHEFTVANPNTYVVGLREGTMLKVQDDTICLEGEYPARIFKHQQEPFEVDQASDLSFLL